ncbi:sensor histidine kinase [Candidatus Leptofilum sp.]|uniref:sensor histidine kinase n=1 Tax=Candidatus Leptofilum sp. TaxID=3241576 RepID=UPI003B5AB6C6
MKRPFPLPIRVRLTLWYLAVLGLLLLLFAGFLYFQLQRNLFNQVDTALELAAVQAQVMVVLQDGRLTFQSNPNGQTLSRLNDDFAISLLSNEGDLLDQFTRDDDVPLAPPTKSGPFTLTDEDDLWRGYNLPFDLPNSKQTGWLQVLQELEPVQETLAAFRNQILLALPLALLLAGLGGYFLAGRALRPIARMTQTAQAISVQDLGKRIHHQGPADEIGRLAQTFDAMLDRLEAAFRREQQFTGDAAHELRTPLTALKGQLEVTLSRPRQAEAYQTTLQAMSQQVERLIHLSSSLLYLNRLEQDQQHFSPEAILVDEFFNALLDQIRPLAQEKSIQIHTKIAPELQFWGQLDLLIQLFLNLLDNAIKYTPIGDDIALKAASASPNVIITLHNNGPSIPPEHLPHLFKRFYRAEAARTRTETGNQRGAGLGLAIAQEIAKIHQGEITVSSHPEQGTTFIVILPEAVPSSLS